MTLVDHLGRCYAARNGLSELPADADFAAALAHDDALRAAAQIRLATLTPDVIKKCHVSRVHRAALEAALSATA